MSGRPSDGSPLAIDPTVGTSRPNALTAAIAPATATSEPGTPGATRRSPMISASESVPTSSVSPCVSPRWRDELPGLLEEVAACLRLIPNSFGSWPMMIVSARPMMKPLSTGWLMKSARKPRRSRPAISAARPAISASPAVNAANAAIPPAGTRSATVAADSAALAAIGPTTSTRELPSAA